MDFDRPRGRNTGIEDEEPKDQVEGAEKRVEFSNKGLVGGLQGFEF